MDPEQIEELLVRLMDLNPDALLLEPRRVYDKAIVGITNRAEDGWDREPGHWIAVYDEHVCVEALMEDFDCDFSTAADWFYTNTYGAWGGEGTPTFQTPYRDTWDE